jgi:hypothetical protein
MSDGSEQPWRVDAARFRGKMRRSALAFNALVPYAR